MFKWHLLLRRTLVLKQIASARRNWTDAIEVEINYDQTAAQQAGVQVSDTTKAEQRIESW